MYTAYDWKDRGVHENDESLFVAFFWVKRTHMTLAHKKCVLAACKSFTRCGTWARTWEKDADVPVFWQHFHVNADICRCASFLCLNAHEFAAYPLFVGNISGDFYNTAAGDSSRARSWIDSYKSLLRTRTRADSMWPFTNIRADCRVNNICYVQFKLSCQIRSDRNFILAWCSYIGNRLRKTWRLNSYICFSAFLLTTIYVIIGLNEIPVIELHMLAERIATKIKPRSNIQFPASIQQLSFVYISSSTRIMHPDCKIFLEKFNNQPLGFFFLLLHVFIYHRLSMVVSSSYVSNCPFSSTHNLQHGFDATTTWFTLLSRLLQTMKSKRMSLYSSIYSLTFVTIALTVPHTRQTSHYGVRAQPVGHAFSTP